MQDEKSTKYIGEAHMSNNQATKIAKQRFFQPSTVYNTLQPISSIKHGFFSNAAMRHNQIKFKLGHLQPISQGITANNLYRKSVAKAFFGARPLRGTFSVSSFCSASYTTAGNTEAGQGLKKKKKKLSFTCGGGAVLGRHNKRFLVSVRSTIF